MTLSSLFAGSLGLEGADSGDFADDQAPLATGDESETASAAIAEVAAEDGEVADAATEGDDLEEKAEQTEEVAQQVEVAAESNGLDPQASALLHLAFKNITGKSWADKKLPKHESFNGMKSERIEATQLALEGIKETLKQFWEAIKAQFKKFWAKIKTWYIKTFDASKKLSARAKKLQERAEGTAGTIENKTFSFGSAKAIAIDGKARDANAATGGLKALYEVVSSVLEVRKAEDYDNMVEKAATSFKGIAEADENSAGKEVASKVIEFYTKALNGPSAGTKVTEADYIKLYGDAKEVDVSRGAALPGDRCVVVVKPTGGATTQLDGIRAIRTARVVMGNTKAKPRDIEATQDVQTLTTTQISKMCDDVVEISEKVFNFKKAWERRDGAQDKIIKEIDSAIKNVEGNKDVNGEVARNARSLANALVGTLRRQSAFESTLVSYSLQTCGVFLSYGERSLAQHKSK